MTTLTPSDTAADAIRADALVLFSRPDGDGARLIGSPDLPKAALSHVTEHLEALRHRGGADEVTLVPGTPKLNVPLVAVSGTGPADEQALPSPEALRRAAGSAVRALAGRDRVAILTPSPEATAAVAEGAAFGAYAFTAHLSDAARTKAERKAPVRDVVVLTGKPGKGGNAKDVADAVAHADVLARHQAWARDLVNTAPNELYPETFAQAVKERAGRKVKVEVLDEKALAAGGFGGIIGVGRGSARPPRMVTMSYRPSGAREHLAFVGKGITFDSGGLCIKPPTGMITMKCDMGGAAAVAGAVLAVAELGLNVAVTGYLCLAENMPGSDAQRPGDVVTMLDGQTVEVINTDAEGRMVLGDGIALAARDGADTIVDIATLTGAAIVALGNRTAAVLANDDELQGDLTAAATAAGESVWPMPIADEIRSGMDSLVADFKHTGEAGGGTMVAAAFLREFAGKLPDGSDRPWGHLDIAGPAYNEKGAYGYTPKGGTGFGVRTLVAFAESRA